MDDPDLLMSHMTMGQNEISGIDGNEDKFLRDMILSFILAGRDTTTWTPQNVGDTCIEVSCIIWLMWRHLICDLGVRD